MTKPDAIKHATWAAGLFPGTTKERMMYLAEVFESYQPDIVQAAVKTHAANHSMLEMPQLLEGLRSLSANKSQKHADYANETIVSHLTRMQPATYPDSLGHYGIITKHFSACAENIRNSGATNTGIRYALKLAKGHCLWAFEQVGITRAEVRADVDDIIGTIPECDPKQEGFVGELITGKATQ